LKKGLVYRSTGSNYAVESEGQFYNCRIKGKMRLQGIQSTNPIAVGDHVFFEEVEHAEKPEGNITEIEERKNYIVRKSVNLSKQTHIIASNIDQALLSIGFWSPLKRIT
jgi:ribosome biogenesis GTPase